MLCTVHINKFTKFKHESLVSRPTVKAKVTTYTYELLKTYFLCLLKNSNFGFVFVTQLRIVLEITCFYKEKGTIFKLESFVVKYEMKKVVHVHNFGTKVHKGLVAIKNFSIIPKLNFQMRKKVLFLCNFFLFKIKNISR